MLEPFDLVRRFLAALVVVGVSVFGIGLTSSASLRVAYSKTRLSTCQACLTVFG
jgi:hypothetical protein